MNRDQEVGNFGQVDLSPRDKLENAIREYLQSVADQHPEDEYPGVLTGWYLVAEQQSPVSGESQYARVVREFQSLTHTLGLIGYSDTYYRAKVARIVP